MTSGARRTVRRICSICAELKPPDPRGTHRPPLKMFRNGAVPDGTRNTRLVTAALPADECRAHQLMRPLFQRRDRSSRASHVLSQVIQQRAAQGGMTNSVGEEGAEAGQEDDTALECRELVGGERRIDGYVCTHERREIGRGSHLSLCGALGDRLPISRTQPDGYPVGRRGTWTRRVRVEATGVPVDDCTDGGESERRLRKPPRASEYGETILLLRRGTSRDRGKRCCGMAGHDRVERK